MPIESEFARIKMTGQLNSEAIKVPIRRHNVTYKFIICDVLYVCSTSHNKQIVFVWESKKAIYTYTWESEFLNNILLLRENISTPVYPNQVFSILSHIFLFFFFFF